MSVKKRLFLTVIFIIISLSLLEISNKALISYKKYQLFGRITPTYNKTDPIDEKEEIKKFFLKKEMVAELYQLIKDMDELLTKNNIKYFLDSGTLLGAIRNNGHIPYDDDADISIFSEDKEKFLTLEKNINKLGYKLTKKYPDWYVIYSKNMALDVFHIKKFGSIYRYANDKARLKWSRFFFYENELLPLKRHSFGNIKVFIPQNPENHLKRGYGEDCLKYAVFSGNHRFGYIGRTLKVPVNEIEELNIFKDY